METGIAFQTFNFSFPGRVMRLHCSAIYKNATVCSSCMKLTSFCEFFFIHLARRVDIKVFSLLLHGTAVSVKRMCYDLQLTRSFEEYVLTVLCTGCAIFANKYLSASIIRKMI